MMPATMVAVPAVRCQPKDSFSTSVPSRAANSTQVSRKAAIVATGARVMAQGAIPYEAADARAPSAATAARRPA